MEYAIDYVLIPLIKIGIVFGALSGVIAYLTLLERKVIARVQMRPGPTRVGPFGLLQPIADGLKFLFKEDVIPTNANTFLYVAAPVVSLIPALLSFSVIPFGPSLQITDLGVGLLFIFAITSLGVYGIVLGGWASNSKYPLLGGLRSSAQMISYELAQGIALVGVILMTGSLSLAEIGRALASIASEGIVPINVRMPRSFCEGIAARARGGPRPSSPRRRRARRGSRRSRGAA